VSLRQTLDDKLSRFEALERDLVDPAVLANPARVAAAAREHGSLAKLAKKYRRFKVLNQQVAEAQEMIDGKDAEMREMAEAELPGLRDEREATWDELLEMTIGGEDAQRTWIVTEIRAGTGDRKSTRLNSSHEQ
jgi:peptide chain release factor 1